MNRDALIKFIPKPSNRDVIVYDTSLKDLIDVDVFSEYKQLLPIFNLSSQMFEGYKNNIKEYEKTLNNIFLYKPNWSEEDYLFYLQNEKKTYANLFGNIKKKESNIDLLQKKIKIIDEKIEFQIAKENKEIEEKKKNIDQKINENVDRLFALKEVYETLKMERKKIEDAINENQEEFNDLKIIVEGISNGECKCRYCGSKLSNVSENSNFYKKTVKNLAKNKKDLEILLEKQQKNKESLAEYETNITEIKQELKNDSSFKSQDFNFYRKKSVEVLKLESQRESMANNISVLQKELENDSQTKSKQFLEMKDRISKYELSLENLQKIKNMKTKIQEERIEYNKLNTELTEMQSKMDQYKKFISIFFKIYEQKASDFCGKGFKFKIFDFENYSLIEKFQVFYNEIEYNNLNKQTKEFVLKTFEEKFLFYN